MYLAVLLAYHPDGDSGYLAEHPEVPEAIDAMGARSVVVASSEPPQPEIPATTKSANGRTIVFCKPVIQFHKSKKDVSNAKLKLFLLINGSINIPYSWD